MPSDTCIAAAKPSPKLWLKLVLVVLYAPLFAEGFIRVFDPIVMAPRYVVDAGYGVRGNWPNASYTHFSREYGEIGFRVNSKGLRADKEFSYEKPANTMRVIGFGDSFTMGYGARSNQTYLARMEHYLKERASCDVEVLNMGVSGFGTAESLIALEREGFKYQPDVVVMQWHRTDLKDNMRSRLFRLSDGKLTPDQEEYLPLVEVRTKLFSNGFYRFLAANSMAYTWFRNAAARITKKSLWRAGIQKAELIEETVPRDSATPGTLLEQRLAIAIFLRAQEYAAKLGAQFIVLEVPDEMGPSEFRSTLPVGSLLEPTIYRPIDDFFSYEGQALYWKESAGHFSMLGNDVVGAGLAARVNTACVVAPVKQKNIGE